MGARCARAAALAELVDAPDLGSGSFGVKVRVFYAAHYETYFLFCRSSDYIYFLHLVSYG